MPTTKKRVLIFGPRGQVGRAVRDYDTIDYNVITTCERIPDAESILDLDNFKPEVVVNAAAYTDVEGVHANNDEADKCWRSNVYGPMLLAAWCRDHNAHLIHYSSDYVYGPYDGPIPETAEYLKYRHGGLYAKPETAEYLKYRHGGLYAMSKALADQAIERSGCRHTTFRVSGVFGDGNNFVRKIAKELCAGLPVRVVDDQVGSPTSANMIARFTWSAIEQNITGTYNLQHSGQCSWYQLAKHVAAIAGGGDVRPIKTSELSLASPRPMNSVLDTSKIRKTFTSKRDYIEPWEDAVEQYLNGKLR